MPEKSYKVVGIADPKLGFIANEQMIVLLDDTGNGLGVVEVKDGECILKDHEGKVVKTVPKTSRIKELKDILVNRKLSKVIV